MPKKLYLRVTTDKYQLPMAVFDTKQELADYEGVKSCSINSIIANDKKYGRFSKFVKVDVEDD